MAVDPETNPLPADPLEAALASLLESSPGLDEEAVLRCCRDNPTLADEVRVHVGFLRRTRVDAPAVDRVGPFRLVARIGGGGMGIVYRAVEEPLAREVALKLIRPEHLPFPDAKLRFRREIEAVAGLHHPGIVPIFSCGEDQGLPYYAMELVAGRSLAAVIADLRAPAGPATGELPGQSGARDRVDACFRIALQVAQALAHAHARGVVHRDVKPSNVMLDAEGRARVIDFGLARVVAAESVTRTGVQPGSLAYMSPEQVRGEAVDARTDVWSLGVTLYELLSLRLPFAGDTEEGLRRSILESTPAPLHGSGSRIPWDAATVVATAMAPERARRYATMAAFAADLQAIVERRPIAARRAGPVLRLRRWVQRRPARAAAIALAVAVLGVLPSTLLWQEHLGRKAIEQEAVRARDAEREARREAGTAQRVVAFLRDVFHQSRPDQDLGRKASARELLDRAVPRIRAELQHEPEVQAALLEAMGSAFQGLGESETAVQLLAECLRLREGPLGWRGQRLHGTLGELAAARHATEDYASAEALLRRVLAELPPIGAAGGLAAADPSMRLAAVLMARQQFDDAQRLMDEVIAARRRGLPADDPLLASALARRGRLLLQRLGAEAAAADQDEALAILRRRLPPNHPELITLLCEVAIRERFDRQAGDADTLLVEAEAAAALVFEPDHPDLAHVREQLALLRSEQGRHDEARRLVDASGAAVARIQPPPSLVWARHLTCSGQIARAAGDLDGALRDASAATAMFAQLMPGGSMNECVALDEVIGVRLAQKSAALAIGEARRVLELRQRLDRGPAGRRSASAIQVVLVAEVCGDRTLVDAAVATALREMPDVQHRASTDTGFRTFARWLFEHKRFGEAEQVLTHHIAAFTANGLGANQHHAHALLELGRVRYLDKRAEDGIAPLREAHAMLGLLPGAGLDLRKHVLEWLGFLLNHTGRPREALPFVQQCLAAARELGSQPEVRSATVSLAQVRSDLGDHAAAAELLWPVLDDMVAAGGQGAAQGVRVLNLLIAVQDHVADAEARAAAFERLRAAAPVLAPPGHKVLRTLEQKAARKDGG